MSQSEQAPAPQLVEAAQPNNAARLASVGLLTVGAVLASPVVATPLGESQPDPAAHSASAAESTYDSLINHTPVSKSAINQARPTDITLGHDPATKDSIGLIDSIKYKHNGDGSIKVETIDDSGMLDTKLAPPSKHRKKHHRNIPDVGIDPTDGYGEYAPLHKLELSGIPENVASIMKTETVYLPFVGCSGALIRNADQTPIGISTAEHCGLRGTNRERITGADGNKYIVIPGGVAVMGGESKDALSSYGTVDTFLLPPNDDTHLDMAFGIFPGHTAEEVMANYHQLSEDQIKSLKLGDTMYMSGWPVDQDNNPGAMKRQSFAMSVLGTDVITNTAGETEKVLWAAAKSNQDGAECSFGASGSEGFIIGADGQPVAVGQLSVFNDFRGDTWGTAAEDIQKLYGFQQRFQADLSGFDVVCGFAYEQAGPPTEAVHVVDSINKIPGHEQKGGDTGGEHVVDPQLYANALANFLDTSAQHIVLRGYMEVDNGMGENGGPSWVKDPVLYYENGDVVLGWSETNSPEGFTRAYAGTNDNLVIHTTTDEPMISTYFSTGEVQVVDGAYIDSQQNTFGKMLTETPEFTDMFSVSLDPKTGAVYLHQGK